MLHTTLPMGWANPNPNPKPPFSLTPGHIPTLPSHKEQACLPSGDKQGSLLLFLFPPYCSRGHNKTLTGKKKKSLCKNLVAFHAWHSCFIVLKGARGMRKDWHRHLSRVLARKERIAITAFLSLCFLFCSIITVVKND